MRHATSEKSGHKEFLTEHLDWLSHVKSIGTRKLPCLVGWQMAINCLLQLWQELHSHYGLTYLLTNRLNQDCVENLSSVIWVKGGHRDNPDATQFGSAFRQLMVDAVMVPTVGGNCQEDVDTFLLTLKNFGVSAGHGARPFPADPVDPSVSTSVQSLLAVMSLPTLDLPVSMEESNILMYIAGYICRKVKSKVCAGCGVAMQTTIDPGNRVHTFLSNKELWRH